MIHMIHFHAVSHQQFCSRIYVAFWSYKRQFVIIVDQHQYIAQGGGLDPVLIQRASLVHIWSSLVFFWIVLVYAQQSHTLFYFVVNNSLVQSQHVVCLGKLYSAAEGVDEFPCSLGLVLYISLPEHVQTRRTQLYLLWGSGYSVFWLLRNKNKNLQY